VISIPAEAEMTGGMATILPGQWSRHAATGRPTLEFWNPGKPELELVNGLSFLARFFSSL
jgi:hypothetical protein